MKSLARRFLEDYDMLKDGLKAYIGEPLVTLEKNDPSIEKEIIDDIHTAFEKTGMMKPKSAHDPDYDKKFFHEPNISRGKNKKLVLFTAQGGKNGSGLWSEYFQSLSEICRELEKKYHPVLYAINTDIPDDVFDCEFILQDKD